jgi:hypothetical protein
VRLLHLLQQLGYVQHLPLSPCCLDAPRDQAHEHLQTAVAVPGSSSSSVAASQCLLDEPLVELLAPLACCCQLLRLAAAATAVGVVGGPSSVLGAFLAHLLLQRLWGTLLLTQL